MKIGIITFHCSYNYGSALQAYALQTFLIKKGYSVEILNYISDDFYQYKIFRPKLYKGSIKKAIFDLLYLKKHIRRKMAFEKFQSDYMLISEKRYCDLNIKEANRFYEVFICGSDQIWNTDCTKGVVSAFFLGFAEDKKKTIAYAPSIAHSEINGKYIDELCKYINRIEYISVREEPSVQMLKQLTDREDIICTADPTLLLEQNDYDDLILNIENADYVFVYMLEWNPQLLKYAKELANASGIPIYYIVNGDSFKLNEFFDNNDVDLYGVGPCQFIGYIRYAKYIVTNSFHATVFSIIYHKLFCCFGTRKSSSRMDDLLSKFGLLDRKAENLQDINYKIDYSVVDRVRKQYVQNSIQYLENVLR